MSRANWDFEAEPTPCVHRGRVVIYLGIASLLLLSTWTYHWFYVTEMAVTIENQTQLLAKTNEKNEIYAKLTQDMEDTLHKQEKLISNMGVTLDQQDHLLKNFSIQ